MRDWGHAKVQGDIINIEIRDNLIIVFNLRGINFKI